MVILQRGPAVILEMARRAHAAKPGASWNALSCGMAEYRSGNHEAAVAVLAGAVVAKAKQICEEQSLTRVHASWRTSSSTTSAGSRNCTGFPKSD